MKAAILRHSAAEEIPTEERCFIRELLGGTTDKALSVAEARVEPGVSTVLHRLKDVDERYVVLSGAGRVEVGNLHPEEVGPGDMVCIPAGTPQRITNTGASDLVFLCLCTPPFNPDCYETID